MKVVILCGGKGTRLREETEFRPKPMLPIGDRPILWHIMKTYAHYGFNEFVLCLGYKGDMIKEYFRNYLWNTCDTTLLLGRDPEAKFHTRHNEEDWQVTLAETGEDSLTGERVYKIKKYVGMDDTFLLTYGDGVGSIDIPESIKVHRAANEVCTIAAVHPPGRFGELALRDDASVQGFNEKPQTENGYINGGYMVCNSSLFNYLESNPAVMLEQEPLRRMAAEGQMAAYKHDSFWQPMDTFQEFSLLNDLWRRGQAPWKVWSVCVSLETSYSDKRVLITGHTGFKGSWLTEWLLLLGAKVTGYSLPPPTDPALFFQLGLQGRIHHIEADVRGAATLARAVREVQPDFVFHLAAQPLVRASYTEPRETYEVNVMGTVNLLEALRSLDRPCAAVIVTADKCYENREWLYGYREEEDALGGHDPYSSSKAAAEIALSAYRSSFFRREDSRVAIASARAGNVIGGGDWASDRILPDSIRRLGASQSIPVRNPASTRPWQHVLEPFSGYLQLGAALMHCLAGRFEENKVRLRDLASAFNFGPRLEANRTVQELVEEILEWWPGQWHHLKEKDASHEAHRLNLATDKAFHLLRWSPAWNFAQTVEKTVSWYRAAAPRRNDETDFFGQQTRAQIREYASARSQ